MSNPACRFPPLVLVAALCTLAACSAPNPGAGAAGAPAVDRSSRTLPIPGGETGGSRSGTGVIGWSTPDGWIEETPSSRMRQAQYRVPGPGGDAECLVFYFGAGQGGDPLSNARRWAGQFTQPDGSSSVDVMQITKLESGKLPIDIVEVTGIYQGGMTMTDEPARPQAGSMLLGGIARGTDAPWFFKFVGPEATVRAQKEAFIAMMESIEQEG